MTWTIRMTGVLMCVVLVSGCQVEQEQQADLPEADVDVQGGQWPEYDVRWADVDVGTEERTITVPVVRVEQETREVTVPYIRVGPPGGATSEERTIAMELDVPHAGYQLQIVEVRAGGDNLWVIGRLQEQPGEAAAQAITRVSDRVVIDAPGTLDVRKVIVGMRPASATNQELQFVDSMDALSSRIPEDARVLYGRS